MTIEERIKDIEAVKKEIRDLCEKLPDAYLNQTFEDLLRLQSKISLKRCELISKQGRLITQQTRLIESQKFWLQGAK